MLVKTNESPIAIGTCPRMTFFHFGQMDGWHEALGRALASAGLESARRGGNLLAWSPQGHRTLSCGISVAEGWQFAREPVAGGEPLLSIRYRSVYFERGENLPSSKPLSALVPAVVPEAMAPSVRIKSCLRLARRLEELLADFRAEPVRVRAGKTAIHRKTRLIVGSGLLSNDVERPWIALRGHGFLSVPDDFKVRLFSQNPDESRAKDYVDYLVSSLNGYGVKAKFETLPFDKFGGESFAPGAVGLVALEGQKGDPLRPEEERMCDRLDEAGAPYRMFSLSNPSLKWSAFDQAASLVYTGGGIPYALDLPWPEGRGNTFLVGVDLSHPFGANHSVLVVSLVDSTGIHLHSWRFFQKRDETADLQALERGLAEAAKMAETVSGESRNDFLVIRDGRANFSERVYHYRNGLSGDLTYVDLSKRSTGHMFEGTPLIKSAGPGSVCLLGDPPTPFLTPVAPPMPMQMVNPQKIVMRESWDGLGLGLETVTDLIAGLCYAPSLGMKPHRSPAPVYWANGIASIKGSNCQFRGQRYSEVHVDAGRASILAI